MREKSDHVTTIAIIQARMASSRLPGKVLLDIAGQPMLTHVVERTRRARTVDQVIVATTTDVVDDPLVEFCSQHKYPYYRGSQYDVLDRYYQAACKFVEPVDRVSAVIVRITSDCPVIDPDVIDQTVHAYQEIAGESEDLPSVFVANRLPPPWGRTFPIGLDTEVCAFSSLELAWKEARAPHQREHVMPFFYDQPDRFRIHLVNHSADYGSLRWTVDTPQDLELVRRIFDYFPGRNDFTWLEILALFEHHPELADINRQVTAKDYRLVDQRRNDLNH